MAAARPAAVAASGRSRGKFFYLLVAQVLLVLLFPYLAQPGLPMVLFRLLGGVAFAAAVYAVSDKRANWIIALVLLGPAGTLNIIVAFKPDSGLEVPALTCTLVFLVYTLVLLLRAVVRTGTVTADTIYGALSVYLLMAFTWGTAYLLLETLYPGALAINATRHPNHAIDWFDCMFYSFVTLTSVGYGDIVPMNGQARSLSILESVTGIMYVAVLVARLVGLYSAARVPEPTRDR